jgi:2-haloacid dehalogenase
VLAAHGIPAENEDVLGRYARHEADAAAGPYMRYRDVLAAGLRGVAGELGFEPTDAEVEAFSGSVADWPAFPDSASALARLKSRYRLGVITNCDDDLFAASNAKLGVEFDWIVTAEQVGAYKPSERNFEVAFERLGLPRERILHVAQSLFHDHVTAKRLGLATVWIDRRGGREGSGATPVAEAAPDATFPDMAAFAAAAA